MRIGLCQLNPTVGDLRGNESRVLQAAARAAAEGARVAIFSELVLCGYPPRDLLDRERFVQDNLAALERVAAGMPRDIVAFVGFVDRRSTSTGRALYNALAVIEGREVRQIAHKRLLPTYDVFDDDRYFEPGDVPEPVDVDGVRFGLSICEDIWNDEAGVELWAASRRYSVNPVADLVQKGVDVIVNIAASPFTLPKRAHRAAMLAGVAQRRHLPVVFVNQVGGNDDILFDGSSAAYGPDGSVWARAAAFEEDVLVTDLVAGGSVRASAETDEAAAIDALTMGTRDYAHKCGFRSAVLGLSGGIDSALTAAIAVRAFGAENVLGLGMPSRYSSHHSREDGKALAAALDMPFREISIERPFTALLEELAPHLAKLAPEPGPLDVTVENIQPRIRMTILMAVSNRMGSLLLTTGNKSEIAVGYCTLYGDMAGGLAVISDLPKTFVYRVAAEINRQAGRSIIPERTLTKAPSAELRPNQVDQDSLPPYEVLDAILERYIEEELPPQEIILQGFDTATVTRVVQMVTRNEYKRCQMPPGLILTRKAFGSGRRLPVAQRYPG